MRQYAAFEYVRGVLKSRFKANMIVTELKSEALKERHWKQLFKALKVPSNVTLSQLTLGQVYDMDLKKNEALIKDITIQPQGEMTLKEYVKQVRENRTSYNFDLAAFWEEKLNRV
ncbi:hypothetical protein FRC10_001164 [Ceratobasidium sp. 414]|nr:hypothetical protein FRC10_001164 [Ceratobasidium sp. 414]